MNTFNLSFNANGYQRTFFKVKDYSKLKSLFGWMNKVTVDRNGRAYDAKDGFMDEVLSCVDMSSSKTINQLFYLSRVKINDQPLRADRIKTFYNKPDIHNTLEKGKYLVVEKLCDKKVSCQFEDDNEFDKRYLYVPYNSYGEYIFGSYSVDTILYKSKQFTCESIGEPSQYGTVKIVEI